jgi:hypothetical protein
MHQFRKQHGISAQDVRTDRQRYKEGIARRNSGKNEVNMPAITGGTGFICRMEHPAKDASVVSLSSYVGRVFNR